MSEIQHFTRNSEREPEPCCSRFLCFFAAPFGVRFLRAEGSRFGNAAITARVCALPMLCTYQTKAR